MPARLLPPRPRPLAPLPAPVPGDAYRRSRHRPPAVLLFGDRTRLAERHAFTAHLAPLRKTEWVVYAKRPFGGPEAVLAYLSRYTHRVAIANSRLLAFDDAGVTFKWKDYRAKGRGRVKVMTLATDELIRRFLLHVLPGGFHRIRHYGRRVTYERCGGARIN